MQIAMPDTPDVREPRDLFDRLYAYAITLDKSMPPSAKSRFMKLVPVFKSFAESIENLTPAKTEYDTQMAYSVSQGYCFLQHGAYVWRHNRAHFNNTMTDKMYRIDSLRSQIRDKASLITTIIDG